MSNCAIDERRAANGERERRADVRAGVRGEGGRGPGPSHPHLITTANRSELLELRVLRLGLLQDGDIGIGVFPESQEISIGGERADAGSIGIRALRGSRL
jgi:hypothetical protein